MVLDCLIMTPQLAFVSFCLPKKKKKIFFFLFTHIFPSTNQCILAVLVGAINIGNLIILEILFLQ